MQAKVSAGATGLFEPDLLRLSSLQPHRRSGSRSKVVPQQTTTELTTFNLGAFDQNRSTTPNSRAAKRNTSMLSQSTLLDLHEKFRFSTEDIVDLYFDLLSEKEDSREATLN